MRIWLPLAALLAAPLIARGQAPTVAAPAPAEQTTDTAVDQAADSGRLTALTARMVLKVVHPDRVRDELTALARENGGFEVLVTDSSLRLKLPPAQLPLMLKRISEAGLVLEKTMERQDLTESIAQLEGRLRSKRDILERLRGFFDDSGVQATLRIEQNMSDLVTEMEQVKGELRVARESARWALVDISFNFQRRDRIVYVQSPFGWLNTVDLDRFLEGF